MKGKTIHLPYNNDLNLIDRINEFNLKENQIEVVFYFAPFPGLTGTGRRFPNFEEFIENGEISVKLFSDHMNKFLNSCKKYGFGTNLLLNSVLLGMPFSNEDLVKKIPKIQGFLEDLNNSNLISMITIGNPYLIELLNFEKLKNIKIKTSVNFQIKTYKSIEILNNLVQHFFPANLYEIEIQKDLLRDIHSLTKIKNKLHLDTKLSIIVNEGCLTGCPYQQAHQIHSCAFPTEDLMSYNGKFNFGIARCKHITANEPWRFLDSNWILPEQLKYYTDLVDSIKLTGRTDDTETIVRTARAYIFQDYDRGNINPLISLMNMEKWFFPKEALPDDFDKILFEEVNPEYFMDIYQKIVDYNHKKEKEIIINPKGFIRRKLHKYEGIL